MKTEVSEKLVGKNGFPKPLKIQCFKCKKRVVEVKYVVPNKSYSKINNWEYWANPEAKNPEYWKDKEARKKDRYICNQDLLKFYEDKEKYWEVIPDLKRRAKLTTYIYEGKFSV